MVAITIAMVGLLGIFSLLSNSLGLTRVVSDRYIATNLAAEGIEVVKNVIDRNVLTGEAFNANMQNGVYAIDFNDESLPAPLDPIPARCTEAIEAGSTLTFDPTTNLYRYGGVETTRFKRGICITNAPNGNSDEMKVESVVLWTTRGGGEFEITLEDYFYNWR